MAQVGRRHDDAGRRTRSLSLYGVDDTFRATDTFVTALDRIVTCAVHFTPATGAAVVLWPGEHPLTLTHAGQPLSTADTDRYLDDIWQTTSARASPPSVTDRTATTRAAGTGGTGQTATFTAAATTAAVLTLDLTGPADPAGSTSPTSSSATCPAPGPAMGVTTAADGGAGAESYLVVAAPIVGHEHVALGLLITWQPATVPLPPTRCDLRLVSDDDPSPVHDQKTPHLPNKPARPRRPGAPGRPPGPEPGHGSRQASVTPTSRWLIEQLAQAAVTALDERRRTVARRDACTTANRCFHNVDRRGDEEPTSGG